MTYLEQFAEQLKAKLEGGEAADAIVAFAVETCRESWKNGLEACKKRAEKRKAPAEKADAAHHYKDRK